MTYVNPADVIKLIYLEEQNKLLEKDIETLKEVIMSGRGYFENVDDNGDDNVDTRTKKQISDDIDGKLKKLKTVKINVNIINDEKRRKLRETITDITEIINKGNNPNE